MAEGGATARDDVSQDAPSPESEASSDASTGDLLGRASSQVSELIRTEMQLARVEMQAPLKHAGIGAGLFGAAGVLALYGVGVLIACVVLALALALPAWLSALIVAGVLLAAAGVAALVGRKQIGRASPPLEQTTINVKKDVRAVKEGRHG